ncbi:MAG: EamA family transporter [Actinobacteria bacterium]|nr:EamA family transporter [Actinomycetota bacterium]
MKRRESAGGMGTGLVALGASLWATDLIFRRGLARDLPAVEVVFWEHLILTILCCPLVMRSVRYLRSLDRGDWVAAIIVGAGSSVVATVLFTEAFAVALRETGNPTEVLLLQKLQPLIVVLAARFLLGERVIPRYWMYAIPAIIGAYLVSVPDPLEFRISELVPAVLSIGAASLWGLGTVLGRRLSFKIPAIRLSSIRFCAGFPVSVVLLLIFESGTKATMSEAPELLALAVVPGLIAVSLYYRGLARTPAVTATLAELAFPLATIVLSYALFDAPLLVSQWIGIGLLAGSITALGLASRKGPSEVGIQRERSAGPAGAPV